MNPEELVTKVFETSKQLDDLWRDFMQKHPIMAKKKFIKKALQKAQVTIKQKLEEKNNIILEQFVKEHKEEINNNEFEKLFVVWLNMHGEDSDLAGSLAGLLIKAKVNFLDYMKRIPENMFASIKGIDSIEFPENIKFINSEAFYDSSIHNIKIKQGTKIENNYFNGYFHDNFIKYVNIEYYD